jgi:hypothetical protein
MNLSAFTKNEGHVGYVHATNYSVSVPAAVGKSSVLPPVRFTAHQGELHHEGFCSISVICNISVIGLLNNVRAVGCGDPSPSRHVSNEFAQPRAYIGESF